MAIHKITSNQKEYSLNFNSYAVMQGYKKYGLEGLQALSKAELTTDMILWGLSDNGKSPISEAEVYEFIDGLEGGVTGEQFNQVMEWAVQAYLTPEQPKKKETPEAV